MKSANYLDLIPGTSNIFEIPDAEEYTCSLNEAQHAHGYHIWFRVYHEKKPNIKPTNVVFSGVVFFDGPMNWVSANFSVASPDVCLKLLSQLGYTEDAPDDILDTYTKEFALITVNCTFPHHMVRLLVRSAYRSDTIPLHFKHSADE